LKKDLYYNNPTKKNRSKKRKTSKSPRLLSEEINSTYTLLTWTLVVMILVLGLTYLYVSSQKSAKGYLLKELQIDYESLTSESKDLENQLIDAQSFKQIEETNAVEYMAEPQREEFSFIEGEKKIARN